MRTLGIENQNLEEQNFIDKRNSLVAAFFSVILAIFALFNDDLQEHRVDICKFLVASVRKIVGTVLASIVLYIFGTHFFEWLFGDSKRNTKK